jgi:hypothetical protein
MDLRMVVPLGVSGVCVASGLALRGGSSAAVGSALLVLGVVAALVVVAMLVARAIGLGRASGLSADPAPLLALRDELLVLVDGVQRTGLLAIAGVRLSLAQDLLEYGTPRLIGAASPVEFRSDLEAHARRLSAETIASQRRVLSLSQLGAAGALLLAMGLTVLSVLDHSGAAAPTDAAGSATATSGGIPAITATALLVLIYGAFVMAISTQHVGGRVMARTREYELAAAMVIDTLVALRTDQGPEQVRELLDRLVPTAGRVVPAPDVNQRQAA